MASVLVRGPLIAEPSPWNPGGLIHVTSPINNPNASTYKFPYSIPKHQETIIPVTSIHIKCDTTRKKGPAVAIHKSCTYQFVYCGSTRGLWAPDRPSIPSLPAWAYPPPPAPLRSCHVQPPAFGTFCRCCLRLLLLLLLLPLARLRYTAGWVLPVASSCNCCVDTACHPGSLWQVRITKILSVKHTAAKRVIQGKIWLWYDFLVSFAHLWKSGASIGYGSARFKVPESYDKIENKVFHFMQLMEKNHFKIPLKAVEMVFEQRCTHVHVKE